VQKPTSPSCFPLDVHFDQLAGLYSFAAVLVFRGVIATCFIILVLHVSSGSHLSVRAPIRCIKRFFFSLHIPSHKLCLPKSDCTVRQASFLPSSANARYPPFPFLSLPRLDTRPSDFPSGLCDTLFTHDCRIRFAPLNVHFGRTSFFPSRFPQVPLGAGPPEGQTYIYVMHPRVVTSPPNTISPFPPADKLANKNCLGLFQVG